MKSALIAILLLAVFDNRCWGYRILGIFPFNSRSHFNMFEQLMKGLARKGHQVDVVSRFPLKEPYPNYTNVVTLPADEMKLVNNLTLSAVEEHLTENLVSFLATVAGNNLCESLGHLKLLEIARNPPKDPPYDLVITELFGANCFIIFGHELGVPVVGVNTCPLFSWIHDFVANPENLAFEPNFFFKYVGRMNFWQRLNNVVNSFSSKFLYQYLTSPQDELIKKYFGDEAPGVRELERSIALILTNTHHSLNGVKPITPAVVEIGGLHIRDEGPELPESLKNWLDESKDGFVYFTFGSMVKIESFPRKTLDIVYESLGKLAPVRVLMKIVNPNELPPGLPENVLTKPWFPQFKILKHKNIRAFITHGGLLSTLEAIHCGVPLIGVPLFGDQHVNIMIYERKNVAVMLNYNNISVASLDAALNAVLKNSIYRDAAKALSVKYLDRPMPAIDTAIYWVEYVIRYGSDALRSPAMDLTWWQVALLDVYAALLFTTIAVVFLAVYLIRIAVRATSSGSKGSTPHSKKMR